MKGTIIVFVFTWLVHGRIEAQHVQYGSANRVRDIGINWHQELLEINRDSTFSLVSIQGYKKGRILDIHEQSQKSGNWFFKNDTLTIYWRPLGLEPTSIKYLVKRRKIIRIDYDGELSKNKLKYFRGFLWLETE